MPSRLSDSDTAKIALPSGHAIVGFPIFVRDTPALTSMANVQGQAAAFLAVMACQLRVLNLLKPLIEIVTNQSNPSPTSLQEFARAAADLRPCLAMTSPPMLQPFLRDLLCVQIRGLAQLREDLRAIVDGTMGRITRAKLRMLLSRYPPIVELFDLARSLYVLMGIDLPVAPTLSASTDRGSLQQDRRMLGSFVAALKTISDALGGC
jgi:hypothetical protein